MKKILIWDTEIAIKNSGGPAGYLYNIKKYLSENNSITNILFVSDISNGSKPITIPLTENNRVLSYIKKNNPLGIYTLLKIIFEFKVWKSKLGTTTIDSLNLNDFDIIHFHSSLDLIHAKEYIKCYKGKIILTSHSPQPLSYERLDTITNNILLKKIAGALLDKYEKEAWEISDKMIFPVKEAVDVYRSSKRLSKYIDHNHNEKFLYCPSAILGRVDSNKSINIRSKLGIPNDALVICYIGRHNHIKGYDELLKFGKWLLNNTSEVYIVVAGIQAPLSGLNHPRWIELGWIDYGNEVISQSDLFILPNKETYFDLVALEVLRTGTPILMSRTGGNLFFEKFDTSKSIGIFFYNYGDYASMKKAYKYAIKEINNNRNNIRESNIKLFDSYFTINRFIERYNNLLNQI